ncbi:DNA polymerase III subunit chi [Massilia sp. TS11]|uniref:DNA polymerase III subunit chi n=1 Tax=Massilia sp. TS11 TaxID=2908003 RepID=UPI001EDA8293|nr:DNA polymerase III subunit chi [Massilia sp. TS11]MCG2583801.1 DNA polymerase III subunit chi [Massilia sp. TS11]
MTQVDFHTSVPDKLAYCCRLVRKAYAGGHRIIVLTADPAALDAALWSFSATDFLPHVQAGHALADQTPVVITPDLARALPPATVLVNLSHQQPDNVAAYQRVVEVVSTDPDDVQAGRQRFIAYKKQSYQPSHLVVGQS